MTLQQLRYAIVIGETGSMNRAAQILYVSQPSLSSAIRDLEDELGITIFHRGGRGMTLTNDGREFISYARQLYSQYEAMLSRYGKGGILKQKFGVSAQHYSFAVQSFVELVKHYNTAEYEFAIRETKTRTVIEDVSSQISEIGILYLSTFNRSFIQKMLRQNELEFHFLCTCNIFVYLWKNHPLAHEKAITLEMLKPYINLSFEQGDNSSFYFAEEIFSTNDYQRTVKVTDRATMLNLMIGLQGYTLCSGIICEELNGSDCIAVPFDADTGEGQDVMEIGYIVKSKRQLTEPARLYIQKLKESLQGQNRAGLKQGHES